MKPVYMPFTHLPESMARILCALVGPVVVYQPLATRIDAGLSALADQGVIEIRTPITGDEQRLTAALSEFTQWAAQNPGRSTPGAGFIGAQQGKVPFFDESAINRIRSEIKQYGTPAVDACETGFSARLFLAVAEENDRATARLDQDLRQFRSLEQGFLDALVDSDEANFSRQPLGTGIWQEDPGAKHTDQRIHAWASLAVADDALPDLLITTSPAVMDALMETQGEAIAFERLTAIRLSGDETDTPLLVQALGNLMTRPALTVADCEPFNALGADGAADSKFTITLYAAVKASPLTVIRQMAPAALSVPEETVRSEMAPNTLIVLVECDSKSD